MESIEREGEIEGENEKKKRISRKQKGKERTRLLNIHHKRKNKLDNHHVM